MVYQQLIDGCFASGSFGIDKRLGEEGFQTQIDSLQPLIRDLLAESAGMPLFTIPRNNDDIKTITGLANDLKSGFELVLIFGIGGSSLNGQALCNIGMYGSQAGKVRFIENIDPLTISKLFESTDLNKTACLFISKSGKTPETLAQFLAVRNFFADKWSNLEVGSHIYIITEPTDNPLRKMGEEIEATILDHDRIGGRFATFTNVGLLPAALIGLNIESIRNGAIKSIDSFIDGKTSSNPAISAVLSYAMYNAGFKIQVLFPYIDRLDYYAKWWCQIIAESLGKGGKGITPLKSNGVGDQHSQLQLYLDGPNDKYFTFITLDNSNIGPRLAAGLPETGYLSGKTIGDLMQAEQQATIATMKEKYLPVREIRLLRLNEEVIGHLMMDLAIETCIVAKLLGVDPFDQPAVEHGKILTKEILNNL